MVELVALIGLGLYVAARARARGRDATPFVVLLVVCWIIGETLGLGGGYLLVAGDGPEGAGTGFGLGSWVLIYNIGLLGGLVGAGVALLLLSNAGRLERLGWERMSRAWNRFWFTPADPTLLGLIRLCCGLMALYTLLVYSGDLQEFFGAKAWIPRQTRVDFARNYPVVLEPLFPKEVRFQEPKTEWERDYVDFYFKKWHSLPPPPYPQNNQEKAAYEVYHSELGFDPRAYRLPLPRTDWEMKYAQDYVRKWGAPPPGYARDPAEAATFDEYHARWGADPRTLYARGLRISSIWFDVADPTWMIVVHTAIILVTLLFAIGFCTRVTSVLAWAGMLSYLQRAPTTLFGVDTMMNIVMIYLMIGPSGAALSVDRLIAGWWAGARPRILGRWRAFWDRLLGRSRAPGDMVLPGKPPPERPAPSVSANVAIRLLQIHVCIIYLTAGLAKLRGDTWWSGTAVWYTLANYEFAPMQSDWYMLWLRTMCRNALLLQVFLTIGTAFTLIFEITFTFLIWRRATRWVMLSMALVLHGFIGLLMGLKTFGLMMLIMNMAFLTTAEAYRLAWPLRWLAGTPVEGPPPAPAVAEPEPALVPARAGKEVAAVAAGHQFQRRK